MNIGSETTGPVPAGTWRDVFTRQHAVPLATLCLGVAIYALNGFLVTTALPTAVLTIGGLDLIGWSLTVYLVAAITAGSVAALLKSCLGARRALLLPALLFLAGTLCAASAQTMAQVLAGRVLQGAGEGVIAALCYALIPEMFPARLVPKVFGVEAVVWALAAFGGPLAAGWLTETLSWRAAFLLSVPMALIFMALVLRVVPQGRPTTRPATRPATRPIGRPPLLRLAVCATGIMLVALAGVQAEPWRIAAGLALALLALAALFRLDATSRLRLFPTDAFNPRTTLGAALWVVLLMPVAQAATSVYLVLLVEHVWQYGPTSAGQIQALMALSWSGVALLVAHADDPRRQVFFIRAGCWSLVLGLFCVLLAVWNANLWLLLGAQVAIGAGFGLSWAFLSHAVMQAARDGERDRASAMLPTVQSGGYALGGAIAGLLANTSGLTAALEVPDALLPVAWLLGAACLLALLATLASWRVNP
jgi:MFS family permease